MKTKPLNNRLPSPYNKMSAVEMDAEVAKFDDVDRILHTKPLSRDQRAQHRRARIGRPTVCKGSKRLMITMERSLLSQADALAKRKHLSRSQLIAKGVQTLLKAG